MKNNRIKLFEEIIHVSIRRTNIYCGQNTDFTHVTSDDAHIYRLPIHGLQLCLYPRLPIAGTIINISNSVDYLTKLTNNIAVLVCTI